MSNKIVIRARRLVFGAVVLVSAVAVTASVIPPETVAAASTGNMWVGRNANGVTTSYFDNARYYTPLARKTMRPTIAVASNNYVLTNGIYVNDKAAFKNTLYGKVYGTGTSPDQRRDKAGAAFIIQTILGRSGKVANDHGGRTISAGDWAAFAERIDQADIDFGHDVCPEGNNTMGVVSYDGSRYDISRDDVVSTKCEAGITIRGAGGGTYQLFKRCANPVGTTEEIKASVNDYNLVPTITVSPATSEGSDTISSTGTIRNAGSRKSPNVEWRAVKFRVDPGGTVPGASASSSQAPGAYYGGATLYDSDATAQFDAGTKSFALTPQEITTYPPGTKICFALSVHPRSYNDANWRHSAPACVTIAKKPKVNVLGSDLIVGRASPYNDAQVSNITTSSSVFDGRYYGSWSEYGIVASGRVTGMASAAMRAQGSTSNAICSLSILTFTNNTGTVCGASNVGRFVSSSTAPDVASRFPVTAAISGTSVDLKNVAGSKVYSVNSSTLDVNSTQPIAAGKWVVINDPGATVTITGNITYTPATLNGIGQIPQVVIIAKNIIIAPGVTNVDAWLIAAGTGTNGYINTCSTIPAGNPSTLDASKCNQALTVNGPVQANKLYMYRTAGTGTTAATVGSPAEVFNLRGDAFLWASVYSSGGGRLPTISTKELPPRF